MSHEEASASIPEDSLDLNNSLSKAIENKQGKMEVTENEDQVSPLQETSEVTILAIESLAMKHSQQDVMQTMSPAVTLPTINVSSPVADIFLSGQGFLPQQGQSSNILSPELINSTVFSQKQSNSDEKFQEKDKPDDKILPSVFMSSSTTQQESDSTNSKKDFTHQELGQAPPLKKNNKIDSSNFLLKNSVFSQVFQDINASTDMPMSNATKTLNPAQIGPPLSMVTTSNTGNTVLSDSIKAASRPILQITKSITKSFAQIAAPPTVAESIPNKGSTPDCGLLVERLRGSLLDDYARAIEVVTGKKTLVFIGQSPQDPEYVLAFLERPELVNKIVSAGILVRGKWLCVTHNCQPATKLIVSNVLPFIPDDTIIKACRPFGEPVYEKLRRVPSSVRAQEFKHLLSYRRELLIVLDKNKQIPDHIIVYSHNKCFKLGITTPGLVCFNCKIYGHKASTCKYPRLDENSNFQPTEEAFGETSITAPPSSAPSTDKPSFLLRPATQPNKFDQTELPGEFASKYKYTGSSAKSVVTFKPPTQYKSADKTFISDQGFIFPNNPSTSKNYLDTQKDIWQVAGKKGKACPLPKSPPGSLLAKTPKFDKSSNATTSMFYVPVKEQICPPKDSAVDEIKYLSTKSNRRKILEKKDTEKQFHEKNAVDKADNTTLDPKNSNSSDMEIIESSVTPATLDKPECTGITQLKEILVEFQQQHQQGKKKMKIPKKEVDLAQPIIEDLLQSMWNLRSNKRRSVLSNFIGKHPHLLKHLDVLMATIPSKLHSSQVYRTLSTIRQDILAMESVDSRKSRISKT